MATTGAFITDPNLANYTEEAAERAGLDPQAITGHHILSIRRSVGYLFSSWATRGMRQWKFADYTYTVTANDLSFDLPVGTIDVTTVMLKRGNVETPMYPISRDDYKMLHNKVLTGRPDRYFLNKRRDTPGDSVPMQLFFWQAAENNTDQIIVTYYRQFEDGGVAQNTLDIPFRFQEAFVADLAARIAEKFKPERYDKLFAKAELAWKEADGSDQESAPLVISVSYGRRYGSR